MLRFIFYMWFNGVLNVLFYCYNFLGVFIENVCIVKLFIIIIKGYCFGEKVILLLMVIGF